MRTTQKFIAENHALHKYFVILLPLIPTIALADEAPAGIFTFMYAMSIALPYVLINVGFIIFYLFKRKYRAPQLAVKQFYVGLFIFVLGLIIFMVNPIGYPYLKDVYNVFLATFITTILPLVLALFLKQK